MKECHHWISACILPFSFTLWFSAFSELMVSRMRREYTLQPYTTLAQKLSFPAKDCTCFFDARFRFWNKDSSSLTFTRLQSGSRRHISLASISMPKKMSLVQGSTTLFQLIWKPSLRSSLIVVYKAAAQSAKLSALIKKSSKYTTAASRPLRLSMRFTAWVRRWRIPGAYLLPNHTFYHEGKLWFDKLPS